MTTGYAPDPATHRTIGPPRPGAYWSCEYPEMPPAPHVNYSHRCRACIVHAIASVKNGSINGDATVQFQWSADAPRRTGRLVDMLAAVAVRMGDDYLATFAVAYGADLNRALRTFFPDWKP